MTYVAVATTTTYTLGLMKVVDNSFYFFFFQAEDGIRDLTVTGVQTCALPIFLAEASWSSTWRSMTSLMRSSLRSCREREPRKGFKRIVGTHARYDAGGQMRRDRVLPVALPKWGIGRRQGHTVPNGPVDEVGKA